MKDCDTDANIVQRTRRPNACILWGIESILADPPGQQIENAHLLSLIEMPAQLPPSILVLSFSGEIMLSEKTVCMTECSSPPITSVSSMCSPLGGDLIDR